MTAEGDGADILLGKARTGEPQRCGRRDDFLAPNRDDGVAPDVWESRAGVRACSYCGSMHPDDVFAAIEAGKMLDPTDKNYKVYVRGVPGVGKFYFQHFDEAQCRRFIDLLNAKRVTIAGAGFYVRPFFIAPPER